MPLLKQEIADKLQETIERVKQAIERSRASGEIFDKAFAHFAKAPIEIVTDEGRKRYF